MLRPAIVEIRECRRQQLCMGCGTALDPKPKTPHRRAKFCSRRCRRDTYALWDRRARTAYHVLMSSRFDRHGGLTIADLNALASQWRAQDRDAGRVSFDPDALPGTVGRWA